MSKYSLDKRQEEAQPLPGQSFPDSLPLRFKATCFPDGYTGSSSDPRDIEAALSHIQDLRQVPPEVTETLIRILTIDPTRYLSAELRELCKENQGQACYLLCNLPCAEVIDTMARKLAHHEPEQVCELLDWIETVIENTEGTIKRSSLLFIADSVYNRDKMTSVAGAAEHAFWKYSSIKAMLFEHPERLDNSPLSLSDELTRRTALQMHLRLWEVMQEDPLKN